MRKISKKSEKAAYTSDILAKMAAILYDDHNPRVSEACMKVSKALKTVAKDYEKEENRESPFGDLMDDLFAEEIVITKQQPAQQPPRPHFGKNFGY